MNQKDKIINLLNLTNSQVELIEAYEAFLYTENDKFNITGIKQDEYWQKVVYDSLYPFSNCSIIKNALTLADMGTGGGLPGILLAIIYTDKSFVLLDSNQKKCTFVNQVIEKLGLKNVTMQCVRIEEYAKLNTEAFDVIVSRAFAPVDVSCELACRMLKIKGVLAMAKSRNYESELQQAKEIIKDAGLQLEEVRVLDKQLEMTHILIKIKKIKVTPNKYPRKWKDIKWEK